MKVIEIDDYRPSLCYVARTVCRTCGVKHVAVVPDEADPDRLECHQCHELTARITHYIWELGDERPRFELVTG